MRINNFSNTEKTYLQLCIVADSFLPNCTDNFIVSFYVCNSHQGKGNNKQHQMIFLTHHRPIIVRPYHRPIIILIR